MRIHESITDGFADVRTRTPRAALHILGVVPGVASDAGIHDPLTAGDRMTIHESITDGFADVRTRTPRTALQTLGVVPGVDSGAGTHDPLPEPAIA